jgi:hypothetical protein
MRIPISGACSATALPSWAAPQGSENVGARDTVSENGARWPLLLIPPLESQSACRPKARSRLSTSCCGCNRDAHSTRILRPALFKTDVPYPGARRLEKRRPEVASAVPEYLDRSQIGYRSACARSRPKILTRVVSASRRPLMRRRETPRPACLTFRDSVSHQARRFHRGRPGSAGDLPRLRRRHLSARATQAAGACP